MKIHFVREQMEDEESIKISYVKDSEILKRLKRYAEELNKEYSKIELYQDDTQYYMEVDKILFFETEDNKILAHTKDDVYSVTYRLYELEQLLPGQFIRVSKSTILNAKHIYSVEKNVTSSSCVEFNNTHKTVYVSRRYYKELKNKLQEVRRLV